MNQPCMPISVGRVEKKKKTALESLGKIIREWRLTLRVVGLRSVDLSTPCANNTTIVARCLRATVNAPLVGVLVRGLNQVGHGNLGNVEFRLAKIESGSAFRVILNVGQSLDVLSRQTVIVMGTANRMRQLVAETHNMS
jgi:hypothetical protein